MRIAIVTGIFPPDIGGPATHANDLRRALAEQGHEATVVTQWDGPELGETADLVRFPRRWPWLLRMAAVAGWIATSERRFDAVYATGMHAEAVLGARLAGLPVVVKIVGDPVWERASRLKLTSEGFEAFLKAGAKGWHDPRIAALRWIRNQSLRHSSAIVTPSAYLASVVETWLAGPSDVTVVPNGVRLPAGLRERAGPDDGPLRLVYVGRLIAHKRVERLIEAVAQTDGWRLEIIGSGPERERLEAAAARAGNCVAILGEIAHDDVLWHVAQADALALASDYEGLPHVVIEALAVGTPVVSPPVGGVPEVVTDGADGLIVADASVEKIAAALARLRDDEGLRKRLRAGAVRTGAAWRFDATVGAVLETLERARRMKPRLVFLGKTHVGGDPALLRGEGDASRWRALVGHAETVVIGVGRIGGRWVGRARVLAFPDLQPRALYGALFYAAAPLVAVAKAARRRPSAVICQSPYEGVGVVAMTRLVPRPLRPCVVVEVHGDWRTATRLYGSPWRRLASPVADRAAEAAIRAADRVRVIGDFTERLVRDVGYRGPMDRFVAFGDLHRFMMPVPTVMTDEPRAVFVGALEPAKSVDVLIEAWRIVAQRVPGARLSLAGDGSRREALERQATLAGLGDSVRFEGAVSRNDVRDLLDRSRVLVLPSRSEGLGRVILEAFARARPAVATRVGGIPELVIEGETGLLVSPENPEALAKALAELLCAPETTAAMGRAARRFLESRDPALDFAAGIGRLAEWVLETRP